MFRNLLTVLILPAVLTAQETEPDARVVELRETIAKLVDVKALISEETTGWEESKVRMNELLGLHRRELELLDEELEKAGQSAGGYDETKRGLETRVSELKVVRATVSEAVARHQPRMLALAARLPEPLQKETLPERENLEAWESGDEPRDGMQALLGIVAKAEQFNRRVTRTREVRGGREVEVIYLGLARAYYADRSGNAGTGVPGPEGWEWTARDDLNREVVKALDELDRKRPPELVKLPVEILEVDQ